MSASKLISSRAAGEAAGGFVEGVLDGFAEDPDAAASGATAGAVCEGVVCEGVVCEGVVCDGALEGVCDAELGGVVCEGVVRDVPLSGASSIEPLQPSASAPMASPAKRIGVRRRIEADG